MKFEKQFAEFKEYLVMKNMSQRTIGVYTNEARRFLTFVAEHYARVTEVVQITQDIVLDFCSYLATYRDRRNRPLKGQTQRLKLVSVRKFFHFLFKAGLSGAGPDHRY
jgi:site-specific recombinase XerD